MKDIEPTEIKRLIEENYEILSEGIKECGDFSHTTVSSYKDRVLQNMMISEKAANEQIDENEKTLIEYLQNENMNMPNLEKIVYKLTFIYLISIFEVYFKNLIKLVLRINYRYLIYTSKKKLNYEHIFKYDTIVDLFEYILDKEINEISYKNVREQVFYLKDKFNLEFTETDEVGFRFDDDSIHIKYLVEIFAMRNIILHSHGIANEMFINLVPETDYNLGDEIRITESSLIKITSYLNEFAAKLESIIKDKYCKDNSN